MSVVYVHLASVVDSAMEAVPVIDQQQQVALFNPGAERIFGVARSEAIGRSIVAFLPARDALLRDAESSPPRRSGAAQRHREDRPIPDRPLDVRARVICDLARRLLINLRRRPAGSLRHLLRRVAR
jgi:PAS domain-containing protein